MNYDIFINEWNNRQVTRFGGECVALIAEFEAETNRPIVWGDAHQWINNPTLLSVYDWVNNNPNDPNQLPNRGDIVVWNLPNEHIAFYDHNLGNHQFMSFGQNSGGPTAHFQPHGWANVAGWYTNKQAPPPPPPAVPQPEVHPYTIELIAQKQVIINKPTHRWGMTYDNFTAIANNPIREVAAGEIITVSAICHHSIGYNYYLPDANEPSGYNTLDCDDYTPPPPPPPEPIVLPDPPAAPMTAPTSEQYEVIKTIPGYMTSNRAANHISPSAEIEAGVYFVFNRVNGMVNVTKVQGQPNSWINPADNVPEPEPVPEPPAPSTWVDPRTTDSVPDPAPAYVPTPEHPTEWKASNRLLYSDGRPELYISTNLKPVKIYDMDRGHDPITLQPNTELHIVSLFEKDGVAYGRAKKVAQKNLWYGIPLTILRSYDDIYSYQKTLADRVATNTKKFTDYPTLWFATLKKLFDKIFKTKETN